MGKSRSARNVYVLLIRNITWSFYLRPLLHQQVPKGADLSV